MEEIKKFKGLKIPINMDKQRDKINLDKMDGCIVDVGSKETYGCDKIRCDDCIVSAKYRDTLREYLNEGGKDVKYVTQDEIQEKVCVLCRDHYEMSPSYLCEGVKCDEAMDMYLEDNNLRLKENKMKSNDINKNVAAVFSNKSGEELLLVDKHYDRDMMDRILMETHKVAILKACKAAEAELLEETMKDK